LAALKLNVGRLGENGLGRWGKSQCRQMSTHSRWKEGRKD